MGGNNSVVECNLAKVEVASSNLVSRSITGILCDAPKVRHRLGPFFIDTRAGSLYKYVFDEKSAPDWRTAVVTKSTQCGLWNIFFEDMDNENPSDPGQ
jgi:hypothetical protein